MAPSDDSPPSRQASADPLLRPPAWVQDAVFYQIFPDRFARSDAVPKASHLEPWDSPPTVFGYKGGDLRGVIEHLDHLVELGVTALYFNPIFQSASNHRYHTHDYFRVDPMLGGDDALRDLLDAAHAKGMRVVLDGVFNHASRGFFQFSDILENGRDSAYLDWFHIERFPLHAYGGGELGYHAWWDLPALPKFDTDTEAVREFLWRVGTYWLEFGIDGWRLDVPSEIDDDAFWREFRRRCRAVDPECYIVGEIWDDADRWLQGDQFDAVMNYPLTRAIFGFVAREIHDDEVARSGYGEIETLDANGFGAALTDVLERYPEAITHAQLNLLGSHDTPRAMNVLCHDEDALRMALSLLFALPGAPCLYYGDEIGLAGGHDPACREAMPWDDRAGWDTGLMEFVQERVAERRAIPALRRGAFAWLGGDAGDGGVAVFARWLEDGEGRSASEGDADPEGEAAGETAARALVCVANASETPMPLALDVAAVSSLPPGRYRDASSGLELTIDGARLEAPSVPPRTVLLLAWTGAA